MKWKAFGREFEIRKAGAQPLTQNQWVEFLGGRRSLDAMTALQVAAVFRCVDVIAKTVAALPLHLFKETENGKDKARNHPLYKLLYVLPNKHTTAYDFWHMYIVNLLLTKGAFARIERNGSGRITALWNIPTCRVSGPYINEVNGERYFYVYDDKGNMETLRDGDYMYTPSLRFMNDADPTDPIAIAADVLGLTMDLNRFAQKTFESGANPGGYLEVPGKLSDVAYKRFKADFDVNYAGVANAGRWLFLEEGTKAVQMTRDMEKSQGLESRKFAVLEICRMFGVPPHLVYELERATFSNIEQQSIEFAQNCITPMCVRLEQTIYRDDLTEREQRDHFAKFNVNALMRGDMAARTAYFGMMRDKAILNADEIRELEDMDKIANGLGEIYTTNGSTIALSNVPQNLPKGAKTNATA